MFVHKNSIHYNSKIVVGIFTLYFYKILLNKNLLDINDWKDKLINNKIWKIINKNYNQEIFYFEDI